ncbi:MAG: hypothetical protein MUC35_07060, partial [Candidatus Margulisbacteria bacterium]|nr:hypothetical protein [Candidatus Margulisiibacteriota bacterium]
GHFEIGSSAGNNIYFRPGDSGNPVTFTTAGNVGIGTTEPSTKLEIAGTVRATSFEGSGAALTGVIASSGSATDSTKVLKSGDTMSGNLTVETDIRLSGAASAISGPNFKITPEGGYAIRLKNFTGATSVKGTLAAISNEVSGEMGFLATPAESDRPIGAVYDSGVANGEYCWVVVAGIADVLLKNSTATAAGYFMMTSDAAGRALPKADGPQNVAEHNREIGHCLETKSAGTNVLAKIVMHFN